MQAQKALVKHVFKVTEQANSRAGLESVSRLPGLRSLLPNGILCDPIGHVFPNWPLWELVFRNPTEVPFISYLPCTGNLL